MDELEAYKFCKLSLSLSLSGKLFLFTLMQIWRVSFRARSCLHWLYWKNDISPTGIEHDSIPAYHEIHVFATVIRSFHCFKIGSYKFLAEGDSVYWLTAYCISMPPPHQPPFFTGMIHKKKMLFPIPFRMAPTR